MTHLDTVLVLRLVAHARELVRNAEAVPQPDAPGTVSVDGFDFHVLKTLLAGLPAEGPRCCA